MSLFSAGEIIQLGIQIEQNGREYYLDVAKKSKSKEAKEIFEFLADEESKHEKVFKAMLSSVEKYESPEAYSEDYDAYMKSLSKEHVFTGKNKGKEAASLAKSDLQAVGMAIGFEKDSILLFQEMKKLVSEEGHAAVDKLIEQEQGHLAKLALLKGAIKS
ncbi:MAG: ferritin family protein [Elusimicrobiota bacterium]